MSKLAFEAHRINRDQLKPLRDAVIVSEMNFDERLSNGGIVLVKDNGKSSGIRPRWGKVYAVGPDQHAITVGTWICVEHGRWTRGVTIEDTDGEVTIRRVDPNDILLVSDSEPSDDSLSSAVLKDHVDRW
jgi:co-chaperonin GroES (HSP10)